MSKSRFFRDANFVTAKMQARKIFILGFLFNFTLFAIFFSLPVKSAFSLSPYLTAEICGKTIRSINIEIREIFENGDLSWLYRTVNKLKTNTKEEVVKQELLFKEGQVIDQFMIDESLRNLRSIKHLRNAEIIPRIDGNFVDLTIVVQDTWTLIPQVSISSGTGKDKQSYGIGESDLLGYGKRLEILYEEDDNRDTIEAVWDDRRVLSSDYRLLAAAFRRTDGDRTIAKFDKPFRTLLDENAWMIGLDDSNTIGRLFEHGDEDFIFRQKATVFDFDYKIAKGNPEVFRKRYALGYRFDDHRFSEADDDDFRDLDLDPDDLDQDPARLASNRRFSGPLVSFSTIEPDYISLPFIDRFNRVQDYNLGDQFSFDVQIAPESLGSSEDALIFSANRSKGMRFTPSSFLRGEIGFGSRLEDQGLTNMLARAELKYYNVLGSLKLGICPLGRHTLAFSSFLDYGHDLDLDRELSIGSDNALRGYKARTFTGDKRFALNLEDRIHIISNVAKLIDIGMAFFIETGGATERSLSDLFQNELYADFGLGLRLAFPRSSGERVVRLDVAFPIREGPDGSEVMEPRIIFSGGQLFSAHLRSERLGSQRATAAIGFDR